MEDSILSFLAVLARRRRHTLISRDQVSTCDRIQLLSYSHKFQNVPWRTPSTSGPPQATGWAHLGVHGDTNLPVLANAESAAFVGRPDEHRAASTPDVAGRNTRGVLTACTCISTALAQHPDCLGSLDLTGVFSGTASGHAAEGFVAEMYGSLANPLCVVAVQ